jgi:hypothetical protein
MIKDFMGMDGKVVLVSQKNQSYENENSLLFDHRSFISVHQPNY